MVFPNNVPAFLQNSPHTFSQSNRYNVPRSLKLIFYVFCIFSSFHVTKFIYDKIIFLFSFVDTYQVKILHLEKKLEKLESQLEVSNHEIKRLNEDNKKKTWDIERTLLKDYISKVDHESFMKHFKDFISSNSKQLKKLFSKQQDGNTSLQNQLINMFQSFLKMQSEQNDSLHSIILNSMRSFSQEGSSELHLDQSSSRMTNTFNKYLTKLQSNNKTGADQDIASTNSVSDSISKENQNINNLRQSYKESDSSSNSNSDEDTSSDDRHAASYLNVKVEEKRYIQDLINENENQEDFDDIYKQHLKELHENTSPITKYHPLDTNLFNEEDLTIERSTGGIRLPTNNSKDANPINELDEGVVYESVSFIPNGNTAQQLTQSFRDSVQKDEKMKKSKLISFFDQISKDPTSIDRELNLTFEQDNNDNKQEEIQDISITQNKWEMNEEAKNKLNELFENKFKKSNESINEPLNDATLALFIEFESYNFEDDLLFRTRLNTCKESGEYADILTRMNDDENLAMLKVKGNYYSYSINPAFDFNLYIQNKSFNQNQNQNNNLDVSKSINFNTQNSNLEKNEISEENLSSNEMKENQETSIKDLQSTNENSESKDTTISTPKIENKEISSNKTKSTPKLKPWERKNVNK